MPEACIICKSHPPPPPPLPPKPNVSTATSHCFLTFLPLNCCCCLAMQTMSDMKTVMPLWMNTSIAIFKDAEANKVGLSEQMYVKIQAAKVS